MTADLIEEAREPLDDARKLLSRHVEDWTRRSAEIAEGIVTAYVDTVPALLDTITALQARAEAAEAKLARMETAPFPDETGFYGLIGDEGLPYVVFLEGRHGEGVTLSNLIVQTSSEWADRGIGTNVWFSPATPECRR